MGLFDGRSSSSYDGHGRSQSHRGISPARSTRSTHSTTSRGAFVRPSASRSGSSYFGGGGGGGGGSRGIFGSSSGSSYYKRSPRQGYISYLMHKLQRMFRELWYYARRHPMKAFFAVIVPLLSAGGAIGGLMKQFGVRVPGMSGGARRMGGGYYGSSGYGGDRGGGLNMGSLMQVARAFM